MNEHLDETLDQLEKAVTIEVAASFPPHTCDAHDSAYEVLADARRRGFDHVPVRVHGQIAGVLMYGGPREGATARESMQPVSVEVLVAKSDPLLPVLEGFGKGPGYRLVLERGEIVGILTGSDFHKASVRGLIFARITHLELLLAEFIRARSEPDPNSWLALLKPRRQELTETNYQQLKETREDIDLVEAALFCDKATAAVKLGFDSGMTSTRTLKMLGRIERLRNHVAHASKLVPTLSAAEMSERLTDLRNLIQSLRGRLRALTRDSRKRR